MKDKNEAETEIAMNEAKEIESMIYEIRGRQVMLDSDLARLYECKNKTKEINQAVTRNMNKFPERFSWILSKEELNIISRSQNVTLNNTKLKRGQNIKYLPRVFTEQGVAMLATVLKSKVAAEVSIQIMDAFVAMRKYISSNLIEQKYYNDMTVRHDHEIKSLQESFTKLEEKRKTNEIYFNGQIYDAYSKILEIFTTATKELVIVDNYADNTILDIIKRLNIKAVIITKRNGLLTRQDLDKYNAQYKNLKVIFNNTFHDRYFILDEKEVYHCGASVNRIGYKTFSITLISDEDICLALTKKVQTIVRNN